MAKRWPPTVGILGFDGGIKPAIALTVNVNRRFPQEDVELPIEPEEPVGACCFEDGRCDIETEAECADDGGTYQGDDTDCEDPDLCPNQLGACCLPDGCEEGFNEEDCIAQGGEFQGADTTCVPDPCGSGACCVDSDCSIGSEADCEELGGTYQGDDTVCDPNPCTTGACCNPSFGFEGFLFLHSYGTRTIEVEETVNCASFEGSNSFFQTLQVHLVDTDCVTHCIAAGGTSDCTGGDACDPPCHKDYSCDGFPGDLTCFGLFDAGGLGWCPCASGGETIISDSVKVITCDECLGCGGEGTSSSYTITVTLSGMCPDA